MTNRIVTCAHVHGSQTHSKKWSQLKVRKSCFRATFRIGWDGVRLLCSLRIAVPGDSAGQSPSSASVSSWNIYIMCRQYPQDYHGLSTSFVICHPASVILLFKRRVLRHLEQSVKKATKHQQIGKKKSLPRWAQGPRGPGAQGPRGPGAQGPRGPGPMVLGRVEFTAKDGKIWSVRYGIFVADSFCLNHLNQSFVGLWKKPKKSQAFCCSEESLAKRFGSAACLQPPSNHRDQQQPLPTTATTKNKNMHQQQSWTTKNNRQQQQWLKVNNHHSNPRTVYNSTAVQHYNITTVQRYNTTTL